MPFPGPSLTPAAPAPAPATDPRVQVIARLKDAVNVLVTVSNNPSVDQLASAIGFTLILNKLKKHGTAVFSGEVPSTIEFLQPEKTLEKNTDSLRDFIIALDKSKADKLRSKVEDKYVKIFITPYHTSLSERDLEFGQGDFNVDVIVALGVDRRDELDQAITAHGRILHDATVISVTKEAGEEIGAINWHVPEASSFSEILVGVSEALKSPQTELFDQQIATAFLTGIVSETERFSNDKTTPATMNMAAILMRAGADQQLIASKLDEPEPIPEVEEPPQLEMPPLSSPPPLAPTLPSEPPEAMITDDGSLQIAHENVTPPPPAWPEHDGVHDDGIHIDENGTLHHLNEPVAEELPAPTPPLAPEAEPEPEPSAKEEEESKPWERMEEPPAHGGMLTANSEPEGEEGSSDPLSLPPVTDAPMLDHEESVLPHPVDGFSNQTLAEIEEAVDHDDQTLQEIEQAVQSPHLEDGADDSPTETPHLSEEEARHSVEQAETSADQANPSAPQEPIAALNTQPVDLDLGHDPQPPQFVPAPDVQVPNTAAPPEVIEPTEQPAPPPTPPPMTAL